MKLNLIFLACLLFFGCHSKGQSSEKTIIEYEVKEDIQHVPLYEPSGDKYILPNENMVFSFETTKGKILVIVVDKNEAYIKYRFGTKDKIELEYPATNENTWSKFDFYFYMRGGGPENEGLEERHLTFENNDVVYTVYDDYYSGTDESTIGVMISIGEKEIDIKGILSTQVGSLGKLRDYEQLNEE